MAGVLNSPTGNTLTTQHNYSPSTTYATNPIDLLNVTASNSYIYGTTTGTTPGQYDCPVSYGNLALTTNDVLTLSTWVLVGGATVTPVRYLEFTVINTGAVAITLAPNTTHGWTNGIPTAGIVIQPGGYYSWASNDVGVAVTSGSNDQVKISVSSGTGSYILEAKGRSV